MFKSITVKENGVITVEKHKATSEKSTWKDIRSKVAHIRPELTKIIDELDPQDDFPLIFASYPYGRKIVDKGTIQLPAADGKVVPIDAPTISKDFKHLLKRRSVPVSLMLKNTGEVYYEMPDRIITLNLFQPGAIFGLWENLDPTLSHFVRRIWSVSSGARSVYLLPKITDVASHKELKKKYGIRSHLPKSLLDHWQILVEIANSQAFDQDWHSEVLFFSDKWIDTAISDPAWKDFYNYLLQDGWNQSQYWRNKVTFDIVWELFTNELIKQNMKPNPYFVSIIKHLVLVGTGVLPASTAADNSNAAAPIQGLQEVFINDYKLKDYVPTIMQPHVFSYDDGIPAYYSLQLPALLETPLVSRQLPSILSAMPEIMFLMDTFQTEVLQGEIKADNTPIEAFAQKVVCDYFHSEADGNNSVRSTKEMPLEDKRLVTLPGKYNNRVFAETGHFCRGCIRLSTKKDV